MYDIKQEIDELNAMYFDNPDKQKKKAILNQLLNKYGESRFAIEDKCTDEEYGEYLMCNSYMDEVLEERKQQKLPLLETKTDTEENLRAVHSSDSKVDSKSNEDMADNKDGSDKSSFKQKKEKDIVNNKQQAKDALSQTQENTTLSEEEEEEEEEEVKEPAAKHEKVGDLYIAVGKIARDQVFRKRLVGEEGYYNFVYLDSAGLPTYGEGFNLSRLRNVNEEKELEALIASKPYYKDTGKRATTEQIKEEYAKLVAEREKIKKESGFNKKYNYKATYYREKTKLRYSKEDIDREYERRIAEAFDNLNRSINKYNKLVDKGEGNYKNYKQLTILNELPLTVLYGLLEMTYNVGILDYPKMFNALARNNYAEAAKQSHRNGISDERNDRTYNLFKSLAQE